MKFTKAKIKQIIREEITRVKEGSDIDIDPDTLSGGPTTGDAGVTYYALIEVEFEGTTIRSARSLEELKEELAGLATRPDTHVQAIFTADVLEGSLE